MPYFKDAEDVYANLGRLFEDIIADDDLRARFQGADTVFQYRMRRPDSQVTVKALGDADPQVEFGITELQPEIVLAMDADTAHRFWLGKVNVTVALARGQMKAKGPVAKILKLVPLVKPVFPKYRQQLAESGREDLVDVA
jgi:putative sterol carrier protein